MKKTSWAIIGLSVCVVVLSIALAVVITQKKTETTISTELYDFSPMKFTPKPWLPSSSFSIRSDYTKTKSYYYGYYGASGMLYSIPESELDKRGDFLGKSIPGLQGKVLFVNKPYQTKEKKK